MKNTVQFIFRWYLLCMYKSSATAQDLYYPEHSNSVYENDCANVFYAQLYTSIMVPAFEMENQNSQGANFSDPTGS